jgi:hypothetical protein
MKDSRKMEAIRRAQNTLAANRASRFGTKDDTLSLATSVIWILRQESEKAKEADAAFDAGEFSGPAHERMLLRAEELALSDFGFTPESFNAALAVRGLGRFAQINGLWAEEQESF